MSRHEGKQNARKLREYLEKTKDLPYRNAELNKQAIAREAGLKDRQPLYKNEECVELLGEFAKKLPVRMAAGTSKKETELERKNRSLETKNAKLYAENQELRRQLLKLEHIESLLVKGRGIQP